MTIICKYCKNNFPGQSRRKYCSLECSGKATGFKKGEKSWNTGIKWSKGRKIEFGKLRKGITFNTGKTHFKKGEKSSFGGHQHSKETRERMSEKRKGKLKGNKNFNWKGDKVGYSALHRWVQRELGKPKTCEFCKQYHESGHMLHWANKSREYKRDLNDWLRLCRPCHKTYDKKEAN